MKRLTAIVAVLICVFVLFIKTRTVFETDHVSRITFYAYSGNGIGSDVPAEHMTEIVNWLDSFSVGRKAPGLLPPGTNTIVVEIEYSDGTIIKQGLDTVEIGGILYYVKSAEEPDCFQEILSQTRLDP